MDQKEYNKLWYSLHPEYRKLHNKKMREKRDIIGDRVCSKCSIFRKREYFPKGSSWCKLCNSYYHARRFDKKHGFITCTLQEWISKCEYQICKYCGDSYITGLDRLDNNEGHNINNLIPCCTDCNYTRGNIYSFEEMFNIIGPAIKKVKILRKIQ